MGNERHLWTRPFLAALAEHGVLTMAAEAAGVDRSTVFRRRQEDEEFDTAVLDAIEQAVDKDEREVVRRAREGYHEPVVYQGELQYLTEPMVDEDGAVMRNEKGFVRTKLVRDAEGKPIPLTIRKFSDPLLALRMKGRRKSVYADRTELTGADGSPVKLADESSRAARAAQLLAVAQARRDAADLVGDARPAWEDLL